MARRDARGGDAENQLPETWEESNDKAYYTDKPDWDAFGAMLLVAAAHTYEETIPETLEKGWDFTEHPLIKRLSEDHEHVYSLFRSVMVWGADHEVHDGLPRPDAYG